MRRLGLDIGEIRIGVAVSDPNGRVATPLTVLDARELARDPGPLRTLADDYGAEELVVGLPLTMAGERGPQAVRVTEVAERLAKALGVPVKYHDERLSSTEAERLKAVADTGGVRRKGAVDMVAATVVLQGYLDAHRTVGEES